MRKSLFLLPLLLSSSPALAQQAPQLQRELTDPAAAARLAGSVHALTYALLDMRVGEIQAAVEGRQATPEERNLTVGDIARRDDPDFDRHLQQKMLKADGQMQRSMQALNQALPQNMSDLKQAQKSLERAAANMPDPTYPRR